MCRFKLEREKLFTDADINEAKQALTVAIGESPQQRAYAPGTIGVDPCNFPWPFDRARCQNSVRDRLGWVSTFAQEGDLIAVFYGSAVPFVVRPLINGRHKVIGSCWIEGLMTGEDFTSSTVPDQIF